MLLYEENFGKWVDSTIIMYRIMYKFSRDVNFTNFVEDSVFVRFSPTY